MTVKLKDISSEDIGDVLLKAEKSFGFKFSDDELRDVKTFGELCDIITHKTQGVNSDDCTTQQAFYKLRGAIGTALQIDKKELTVDMKLEDLFPRKHRRRQIREVELILGFQVKVLQPKQLIVTLLFVFLCASLIGLFFDWQAGLAGLLLSIAGFRISERFGKEFSLETIGQLTEKIARENYKKVRRNAETINRKEIAEKVKELFKIDLDLEENTLPREASFEWTQ